MKYFIGTFWEHHGKGKGSVSYPYLAEVEEDLKQTNNFVVNPSYYCVKVVRVLECESADAINEKGMYYGFRIDRPIPIVDLPDDDSAILWYKLN